MKTARNKGQSSPAVLRLALTGAVLVAAVVLVRAAVVPPRTTAPEPRRAQRICPPYELRDELGNVINPVRGVNATAPYSPKQTCGATGCHDYDKITQGYHFTQGKGEAVPADMAARYQWVTSPGNYGGTWCSPAPLYRYLARQDQRLGDHHRHDLGHLRHGRLRQLSSGRRTARVRPRWPTLRSPGCATRPAA